jgi:RHS repeat-associated protein
MEEAFELDVTVEPSSLSRAFLVYELDGLARFTSVPRSVNGRGVTPVEAEPSVPGKPSLQVEEIDVAWLQRGANRVAFKAAHAVGAAAASYGIAALRVVGVPHGGAYAAVPPQSLAALATGVKRASSLEASFEGPAHAHGISFRLEQETPGELLVRAEGAAGRLVVPLKGLRAGWHHWDAAGVFGPTRVLGFVASGVVPGALADVRAFGSPLGAPASDLRVVHPLHGECDGNRAVVRGFASGSRLSELSLDDRIIAPADLSEDGAFQITVPRRPGLRPSSISLQARFVDGSRVAREVPIGPCLASPGPRALAIDEGAPYGVWVRPETSTTLSYGGARLDVPAGAVSAPVRITIRPLSSEQATPADRGEVNVVPDHSSYRFGPAGLRFVKPVRLTLPYDREGLPEAAKPRHISTVYFESGVGVWRAVPKIKEAAHGVLVSETDHFTEFMNATLPVPDAPGVQNAAPDDMQGIKLGSPSAGVDLIQPPDGGSRRSADLGLGLQLPPGRNGLAPNLSLSYSSARGNGWLGVGWDLGLPAIEHDLRFGVPDYAGDQIQNDHPGALGGAVRYLLQGAQLAAVGAAAGGTRYERRVEGAFERILRLPTAGDPSISYWEVTDKSGVKAVYGQSQNARLADPEHPDRVFKWALERIEDRFGNSILFKYTQDRPSMGSVVMPQIYPKKICYGAIALDAADDCDGTYNVRFNLDAADTRPDRIIDARPGFPTKSRHLLDSVDVLFEATPIRSYDLRYREGAFRKTLLEAVGFVGSDGQELYSHDFDYQSVDLNAPFASPTEWGTMKTQSGTRAERGLTKTKGFSYGGGGGLGVDFVFIGASVSAGGMSGENRILVGSSEISGDGVLDFLSNGAEGSVNLFPRSTLADHLSFKPVPNVGRNSLGFTETGGWTAGGGITVLGGVAGLGGNIAHTESEDKNVLADLNGDGFVDQVRVNDGTIKYRPGFKDGFGAEVDWAAFDEDAIVFANQDRLDNQKNAHFLIDPLARWKAPFPGSVEIGGALRKRLDGGDGVVATIYRNAQPIWTHTITGSDLTSCVPMSGNACNGGTPLSVSVGEGDELYFRVSSLSDTRKDLLEWSPSIRYQGIDPARENDREVYGAFVYRTTLADDFRLVGLPKRPWIPSAPGVVEIASQGVKSSTPDDVVLNVYRAPSVATSLAQADLLLTQPLSASFSGSYSVSVPDVRVGRDDVLFFELKSDSPIDPQRVGWDPVVRYTRYSRPDPQTNAYVEGAVLACGPSLDGTRVCTIDNDPTPDDPILEAFIVQSPEVNHDIFMWKTTSPTAVETAGSVDAGVLTKGITTHPVCALIQGVNRLHSKVCLGANATGPVALPAPAGVVPGEPIYFTLISKSAINLAGSPGLNPVVWSAQLDGAAPSINVRALEPDFGDTDSPSFTHDMMSGGYHRWSFGDYRNDQTFSEGALRHIAVAGDQSAFFFGAMTRLGLRDSAGPAYKLRGQNTFVSAGLFSPGRSKAGRGFSASGGVEALRLSDTWSYGINASVLVIDAGLGAADTTGEVELMDMNGDRFADLVTRNGVLFNTGVAGFTAKRGGLNFGEFRQVNQQSMRLKASVSIGGSDEKNQAVPDTDTKGRTRAMMSTSFSVGLDYAVSSANTELLDVNQDGLPDLVELDPDAKTMRVRLNTGYGLTSAISWENPESSMQGFGLLEDFLDSANILGKPTGAYSHRLEDTGSLSAGVAVGGSFSVGIFGGGGNVGAGYVTSINRKATEFFDVNGDGLTDHVSRKPGDPFLLVRLNLGDRFDVETAWPLPAWSPHVEDEINGLGAEIMARANDLSSGSGGDREVLGFSHSRDYSATFDAKVCVFFVCASAYGYYNDTAGGSEVAWTDVNGDGLVDQIAKLDGDATLYVKLNQLGQANLLKSVKRPFGGSFTLGYERYGNEVGDEPNAAVDLPSNEYVLASVNATDGRGQIIAQSFSYADGGQQTGKYDRTERDDYGSAIVTMTRGVAGSTGDGSQVVRRHHNQDLYRQGLVHEAVERDAGGAVFTRQTFTYEDPTAAGPSVQEKPEPLVGSFYPAEVARTTEWFEGQAVAGKTTSETRTWNFDHGGIATVTMTADDGGGDDVFYRVDYETRGFDFASPSDLFLAQPSRIVARQGSDSGPILRDRRATYAAGTGVLETFENRLTGGRIPGSAATYSDAAARVAITRDSFGNTESIIDGNGYELSYGYDATGIYRTSISDSFGYTSTSLPSYSFGTVATSIDVNGNGTHFEFDPYGRLIAVWGPNDYSDDPAERADVAPTLVAEYGLQPGVAAGPFWATMGHKDVARNAADLPPDQHDYVETITFIDGLDRVIQTKKDLEKDLGDHTEVGFAVSGALTFDERGRLRTQGQPIFSQAPQRALVDVALASPGASERSTSWTYDVLSRVTRLTTPADVEDVAQAFAEVTTVYDFGPDSSGTQRFRTTVTDHRGEQTVQRHDVMDRVLEVTERANGNGGPPILTRYRYNPVSELLQVEDANGNLTTASYDTLGRMVSLTNPDTGLTEWAYDLVGNVREQRTARLQALGQRIVYNYDYNRLRQVDYPDRAPRVLHYGTPADGGDAAGNAAARVTLEQSEAGERRFRYDRHGNVAQRDTTFTRLSNPPQNPHNVPYHYQVSYQYDSFQRLLETRYPDLRDPGPPPNIVPVVNLGDRSREVVTYLYDAGGNLQSVYGLNTQVDDKRPDVSPNTVYLAHQGYDEFGQKVRLIAGNFIETQFSYKERTRRLSTVSADHHDAFARQHGQAPRPFQRLDYTYDQTGNVTELRNDAPFDASMHPSVLVGTVKHTYQYDSLDRLVRADGTLQDDNNWRKRYAQEFVYDDIHNITTKTNESYRQKANSGGNFSDHQVVAEQTYIAEYQYSGPRPHAVTRTVEQPDGKNKIFNRDYSYDESGNQTGWTYPPNRSREVVWTSEDQIRDVLIDGHLRSHTVYDGEGQRAVTLRKLSGEEETAYFSQDLTIRDGEIFTKHVFAGATQLATKVDSAWANDVSTLYFHPDHLGSTQYSTNDAQDLAQHDEYFPSGELWHEQTDPHYQKVRSFVFSGKELDAATGLMYFGARHYDPRQSQWLSPDPVLNRYMSGSPAFGVYAPFNLNVYAYAGNNPTGYRDMSGEWVESAWDVFSLGTGVVSLVDNVRQGNWGSAALDAGGVVLDTAALILPAVPAGAGVALKAARAADKVNDLRKGADKATDAAKFVGQHADDAADLGKAGDKAGDLGKHADDLGGCPGGVCQGPGACFTAGTLVSTASGLVPIETLSVGDRVLTSDGQSESAVNPTWRLIELEMPNPLAVHDTIRIQLLRPVEWLAGTAVGSVVSLAYDEIALAGDALITRIAPAPKVAPGHGRVVLGTISHVNNELLRLHLNGDEEVLEPTGPHHFYSADRGDWVAARDLQPGERIVTQGSTATVSRVESLPGAEAVFNLEVESEHEYFVSSLQVLTHNTDPRCGGGAAPTEKTHGHHSDPKYLGGDAKQKLTDLPAGEHRGLHGDMNKHFKELREKGGPNLVPSRVNPGRKIRENVPREERVKALKEFYEKYGPKYPEAAKDFKAQHPD